MHYGATNPHGRKEAYVQPDPHDDRSILIVVPTSVQMYQNMELKLIQSQFIATTQAGRAIHVQNPVFVSSGSDAIYGCDKFRNRDVPKIMARSSWTP